MSREHPNRHTRRFDGQKQCDHCRRLMRYGDVRRLCGDCYRRQQDRSGLAQTQQRGDAWGTGRGSHGPWRQAENSWENAGRTRRRGQGRDQDISDLVPRLENPHRAQPRRRRRHVRPRDEIPQGVPWPASPPTRQRYTPPSYPPFDDFPFESGFSDFPRPPTHEQYYEPRPPSLQSWMQEGFRGQGEWLEDEWNDSSDEDFFEGEFGDGMGFFAMEPFLEMNQAMRPQFDLMGEFFGMMNSRQNSVLLLIMQSMGVRPDFMQHHWRHPAPPTFETIFSDLTALHPERVHPASHSAVRRIPTISISRELEGEACVVCQEKYTRNAHASKLLCGHIFHRECLTPWLQTNNTCPVCRQTVD